MGSTHWVLVFCQFYDFFLLFYWLIRNLPLFKHNLIDTQVVLPVFWKHCIVPWCSQWERIRRYGNIFGLGSSWFICVGFSILRPEQVASNSAVNHRRNYFSEYFSYKTLSKQWKGKILLLMSFIKNEKCRPWLCNQSKRGARRIFRILANTSYFGSETINLIKNCLKVWN